MEASEWQWLKKNWPSILLFLALFVVISVGLYQFFFFIPVEIEDSPERFLLSVFVGFGLTGTGYYLHLRQKSNLLLLKHALQVLAYLDPKGVDISNRAGGGNARKLRDNSLDQFDVSKDIALGLVLESQGVLYEFSTSRGSLRGVRISDYNDQRDMLTKIIGQLDGDEGLYHKLDYLDHLMLSNLEASLKDEFPKQVYFLRLHLLNNYLLASREGKWLVYGSREGLPNEKVVDCMGREGHVTPEGKAVVQFYKFVLNKFYAGDQDYHPQPVNLDLNTLREGFAKASQEDGDVSAR